MDPDANSLSVVDEVIGLFFLVYHITMPIASKYMHPPDLACSGTKFASKWPTNSIALFKIGRNGTTYP